MMTADLILSQQRAENDQCRADRMQSKIVMVITVSVTLTDLNWTV